MTPDTRRSIVKPRDVMPADAASRCRRAYYVDERYFAREMDALFARDVDLRRADRGGRAAGPVRPARGRRREHHRHASDTTARVHAFHNVCRHRGTRLCTEASGAFAGSIQCPYHAWTYGLDGRLIGAPHMDEVPHFRKEDYPLHASTPTSGTATSSSTLAPDAAAARRAARRSARRSSAPWRMADAASRPPHRLRRRAPTGS